MLFKCIIYLVSECGYNRYGSDCQICSSNCETLPCDKDTGNCLDGKCAPGFVGFNCTQGIHVHLKSIH